MLLASSKVIKRKSVICEVLAFVIIISSIAGAVFSAPVVVYALSAGGIKSTIASIIISLLLQTGAAPVNQTWVNSLNNAYGYTVETAITNGLLTEANGVLTDTGLSTAIMNSAEYTNLGLDDIFTTTVADGGVLPASGAVNIANTAINVGTGGTIGAFAGAVAVGVGAGVLINHVRERIGDYIKYGAGMDISESIIQNISYDRVIYTQRLYGSSTTPVHLFELEYNNGAYFVMYRNGANGWNFLGKNFTDGDVAYITKSFANEEPEGSAPLERFMNSGTTLDSTAITNIRQNKIVGTNAPRTFDSKSEAQTYLDSLSMNDIPHVISPDIIGPEGNQYYDAQNNTYPGLVNQVPEGDDMVPVNMDDYQTFIDTANQNTENDNTGQPIQGDGFDDLIDSLLVHIPDKPIIPDEPVDVPEVPERPVIPNQPTMPEKPELTEPEIQDALQGVTTIDLRAIFPFCIPFDLYNILLIFDTGENRKAPHITFTFPFTDWVIDVDLDPFDPVAGILRVLELILFIVGLAVATRALIGAGGG